MERAKMSGDIRRRRAAATQEAEYWTMAVSEKQNQ
jgi:hypothetical protein